MTQDNDIPPVPASQGAPNTPGGAPGPAPVSPMSYQTPTASGGIYAGPAPDKDAKTMAMLSHLLGILLGFLGPLIIWLLKKDAHPFIDDQGKESLNFQLTLMIAYVVGIVTSCIFVGFFIMLGAWVCAIVFGILGTIAANNGQAYRYPFNIRFIK